MTEAAHWALAALMCAVSLGWAYMSWSAAASERAVPRLGEASGGGPRVSVIVPARNEERHVGACLESLAAQDYPDMEVVAVDDSSEDGTAALIARAAAAHPRVTAAAAGPAPPGWVGKNWPCHVGAGAATGDLLLFTDADSRHSPRAVSSAVARAAAGGLDALTVIPRLRCLEFWTSATLPVITAFLHTRFSAARVNDPSSPTGYFFGSFFLIGRGAYRSLGGHEGTRGEIVEDGALGRKAKAAGLRMLMVEGRGAVDAVWARDLRGQWHALRRIMVPMAAGGRARAAGAAAAVAWLMAAPTALLAWSALSWAAGAPSPALLASSAAACSLMCANAAVNARILGMGARWAALAPVGGAIVSAGLAAGLLVGGPAPLEWRGRRYSRLGVGAGP